MIGIFGFPPNNRKFLDRRKSILRIPSNAVGWIGLDLYSGVLQMQSESSEQEIVFDVAAIKLYLVTRASTYITTL